MAIDTYLHHYIQAQQQTLEAIPLEQVAALIGLLTKAWQEDRGIFVCGNGGSAANASHFVTDLGKGASDKLHKPFRCMSLNDNSPWLTALGNDYSYDDVYARQLANFARPGDILLVMSVSGNSPNLLQAVAWARRRGMYTVALLGGYRGQLADLVDMAVVVDDRHFGRVEDAHMGICHMVCFAFMEGAVEAESVHGRRTMDDGQLVGDVERRTTDDSQQATDDGRLLHA